MLALLLPSIVTAAGLKLALDLAPLILLPLAGWVGRWLVRWLSSKTDNEALKNALVRLETFTEAIVRKKLQVAINDLKQAASDGKISDDELATILAKHKDEAMSELRLLLTPEGLATLKDTMGLDEAALSTLLSTALEAMLHKVKSTVEGGK